MIVIKMGYLRYLLVLRGQATLWSCTQSTENPAEFLRLAASNIIRC